MLVSYGITDLGALLVSLLTTYFAVEQCWYLNIITLAGPSAVWNLEITVEAQLQVVSLMGDDLPGTLNIGWEVLGIVWRLDCSHISMDYPSTAWPETNICDCTVHD